MLDRRLCLLFLVVIAFSAQADQEENAGGRVKRFLLKKKTTTPVPSSDAIAALITRKSTTSTSSMFDTRTRLSTSSSKESCGTLNACKNGGTCRTLPSGRYYCFCSSDYYGNNCEKKFMSPGPSSSSDRSGKDHCLSSPCRNAGECVSLHTTYFCRCKTPFYGANCDKRL